MEPNPRQTVARASSRVSIDSFVTGVQIGLDNNQKNKQCSPFTLTIRLINARWQCTICWATASTWYISLLFSRFCKEIRGNLILNSLSVIRHGHKSRHILHVNTLLASTDDYCPLISPPRRISKSHWIYIQFTSYLKIIQLNRTKQQLMQWHRAILIDDYSLMPMRINALPNSHSNARSERKE